MEEDIKNLICTIEMHHINSKPIYDLIAENKKLKGDLYATNCIVNEQIDLLRDSVSKSKIEEEFERMTSHSNCFNLGDMNDLLDRILEGDR